MIGFFAGVAQLGRAAFTIPGGEYPGSSPGSGTSLWQTTSFSSRIHNQNQTRRSLRVTDRCSRARATSRRRGLRRPRTGRTTCRCRSISRSWERRTFLCSPRRRRRWRSSSRKPGRWLRKSSRVSRFRSLSLSFSAVSGTCARTVLLWARVIEPDMGKTTHPEAVSA